MNRLVAMNRRFATARRTAMNRRIVGTGLALAIALGAAGCGDSEETTEGLTVSAAWARPTPGGATAGAVYVTVVSDTDDSIISASVPADIAAQAQLHETVAAPHAEGDMEAESEMGGGMEGEGEMMMTMRQIEGGVDLVAGEPFEFAPGATHIMIFDLVEPLTLGQEFTVELQLESGSSVPVEVVVADTAPTGS